MLQMQREDFRTELHATQAQLQTTQQQLTEADEIVLRTSKSLRESKREIDALKAKLEEGKATVAAAANAEARFRVSFDEQQEMHSAQVRAVAIVI